MLECSLAYFDYAPEQLLWEVEEQRIAFCVVVQHVAQAAYRYHGHSELGADLRRRLFTLLNRWGGHDKLGQQTAQREAQELASQLDRLTKDDQQERTIRSEQYEGARMRRVQAARAATQYLFWGASFEEAGSSGSQIFAICSHCTGASAGSMRAALGHHLISNPFRLLAYVEQCYTCDEPEMVARCMDSITSFMASRRPPPETADHTRVSATDEHHCHTLWVLVLFELAHESGAVRQAATVLSQLLPKLGKHTGPSSWLGCDRVRLIMSGSELQDVYLLLNMNLVC